MTSSLNIRLGQYSTAGCKTVNQDFHGACLADNLQKERKGIAIALADGISSSNVSQIASAAAVKSFLEDYYCTPDVWSVRKSAQRVIQASNSWLYSQTRRSQYAWERDKGYICTFSALILKSTQAHIFHCGDCRVYHLQGQSLEQLTQDHRVQISAGQSYLARALGMDQQLDIDYHNMPLTAGDVFILATDGLYEFVSHGQITAAIAQALEINSENSLELCAQQLAELALSQGSDDNISIQLVYITSLPDTDINEWQQQLQQLTLPPALDEGTEFDGFTLLRRLHISGRSHVYLARDQHSGENVVLKFPASDIQADKAGLERFLLEDWIARRIHSPTVLRAAATNRQKQYLYNATEWVEGQTLRQWMLDNPQPGLTKVRDIVAQIAKGLRAFHRLEMLHQDLKPDNIMIDADGCIKIIDFGAVQVAGLAETHQFPAENPFPGTVQYMAPEYFCDGYIGTHSDLFSLAVITYQMLSGGELPYGLNVAKARTLHAQRRLQYRPLAISGRNIPPWIDTALAKALQPLPHKRSTELSEFIFNLNQPAEDYLRQQKPPLMERDPLLFWQSTTAILLLAVVWLSWKLLH